MEKSVQVFPIKTALEQLLDKFNPDDLGPSQINDDIIDSDEDYFEDYSLFMFEEKVDEPS